MSEKNVGDMSEICRRHVGNMSERKIIENQYVIVLWGVVTDDKCRKPCRRLQEQRKDLAVMKITGIIRYEDKGNVGVN